MAPGPAAARPNVVLFFIDTLRARQVHCLGYPRETTPSLDEFASRGTLFERAIAPAGWSLPSFGAIFTSLPEPSLGIVFENESLDKAHTTLAEIFSTFGYRTAGFVAGGHLSGIFGLDQGFEKYVDRPHFGSFYHTVPAALKWVDEAGAAPFFLFVQGYDAHSPYRVPLGASEMYDPAYSGIVHDQKLLHDLNMSRIADLKYPIARGARQAPVLRDTEPSTLARWAGEMLRFKLDAWRGGPETEELPLTERDVAHVVAHYDGAVTYADTWLGVFLDNLARLGHRDDTIVIVAGDHGEELGEHGVFGHRRAISNSVLHVPLAVCGPGIAKGRRVGDVVELTDLAPTLLELCGIPPSQSHRGKSMAKTLLATHPLAPDDPDRAAFSARDHTLSVRTRKWHLLHDPNKRQLYDVEADPGEKHDLSAAHPEVVERLSSLAKDWDERHRVTHRDSGVVLTEEEREIFRSRGYW